MQARSVSCLCALASLAQLALAQQGRTSLATRAWDGSSIQGNSGGRALSADGRYLLFVTDATNVVPNDTNGVSELFLRDLLTGSIERATPLPSGAQPTSATDGTMSSNARFILFSSAGSDYVSGDTNGVGDQFLRDRQTGTIERVSLSSSGAQGDDNSYNGSISSDGRFVAFESAATTLVSPPTAPSVTHIYVRDRQLGTTVLVDQSTLGATADYFSHFPKISADGRYVLFESKASNLLAVPLPIYHPQLYLRDLVAGTTELASAPTSGPVPSYGPDYGTMSDDARWICFWNSSAGYDPAWPLDGPKLYLRDRNAGTTVRVDLDSFGSAPATTGAYSGSIDSSGRYVLFNSTLNTYVPGDTNTIEDVFVRDLATGITNRVSVDSRGQQANDSGWGCLPGGVTPDGRVAWFWSIEDRLVPGDTNGLNDTYVHARWQSQPNSYCSAKLNSLGCEPLMDSSGTPSASSSAPFLVGAHGLLNQRVALLRYGFAPDRLPFAGGFSCIAPPYVALGGLSTGGSTSGNDCSGAPSFDFNARIQGGLDTRLVPGTVVEAQYLYRDPLASSGMGLTDALQFVIEP